MIDKGTIVSDYEIIEKLGGGGMGVVYKAKDQRLSRLVALKFLPGDVGDVEKQRFIEEAQKASSLDHPYICPVYHVGTTENGQVFICMPYIEGETLKKKIGRGALPLGEVIELAIQIAEALCEVHKHGIIHQDINPSNVIVTNEGIVKLVDFGLSALLGINGTSKPDTIAGTPRYMSPEQMCGDNVAERSDIFSVGVVLYEMIVGQLPFTSVDLAELADEICNRPPAQIRRLRPEVPAKLEKIILKAIEKRPTDRYKNVEEIRTALESLKMELELEKTRRLPATSLANKIRIAVLPMNNNCPNQQEDEYFVNGMTDQLIYSLSKIKGLNVIASMSVRQYKNTLKSIAQIGRELRVGTVLEGSVCKAGNYLRITARLVDTLTEELLWTQNYERETANVFAIQSDISKQVAEALKLQLVSDERAQIQKKATENIEAYDLYLKGLGFMNKRTRKDIEEGITYFARAIEEDPRYALAYAGLADCYTMLSAYGGHPPRDVLPKAKEAAEKALELDNTLAEAYASRGYVKLWFDWNWLEAEKDLKEAISINNNCITAHQWFAEYLMAMRRQEEAIAHIKQACERDPQSPLINWHFGRILYFARRYDEAVEQFRKTIALDETYVPAHQWIGRAYEQMHKPDNAFKEYVKARTLSGDNSELISALKESYDTLGMEGFRQKRLDHLLELSKNSYVPAYNIAVDYAYLGKADLAFEWLEKAYENRSGWVVLLKVDPRLDNLRSDSRFIGLTRRVGLPVRVANGAGFWGDWPEAPIKQVEDGPIDYLTLDYLAEVTMSILQKQKDRDPNFGYATDFVDLMKRILPQCVEHNVKVITNAGGLNPQACVKAVINAAQELHLNNVKVMYVAGDDITKDIPDFIKRDELKSMSGDSLPPIPGQIRSANVYFGAEPIVNNLRQGAQIVITGRCTDTGLTLAPLMYEFDWKKDEKEGVWNKLAAGIVAGHIIECGATCTGGNCQVDWQSILESPNDEHPIWESIDQLANVGYPIIEAHKDGAFVVTKHERAGGQVTEETVKEQLLYELGDPHNFITPECIADISSVKVKQVGMNRVLVEGIEGHKPTDYYKVSICYAAGWRSIGTIIYSWPDAYKKARAADQIIRERLKRIRLTPKDDKVLMDYFDDILTEFIGANACHGPLAPEPSPEIAEVELRIAVSSSSREAVDRFCRELPPLILNGPPAAIGFSEGRPQSREIIAYKPALIRKPLAKPTYGPNGKRRAHGQGRIP